MPTKSDIDCLFDVLWTQMEWHNTHKANVENLLEDINQVFDECGDNFDQLLDKLDAFDGIGPTLASGIIFACHQDRAVPFDDYTMGYALEKRILRSDKITSGHYRSACDAILKYIEEDPSLGSVEEFVRTAADHAQFPTPPK